jgi:hypothetical protein
MSLTDLASPQLALDAQGRILEGDDLDVTSGQSTANAQLVVSTATGLKRRILYVTIQYSAVVTVNVTVVLVSALGAAWNTTLGAPAFAANQSALWAPPHGRFVLAPGDQLQVTAPAGGGGITSAIAIYDEIMGLTARAVDATS